jgi:hypothetical protein
MDSHYETLGLGPGASPDEVKQAYRDLVQVWHPDRFAHDPCLQKKAEAKLKEINEAYACLQSAWGDLLRDQPAPLGSPSSSAEPAERPSGERVRNLLTWAPSSERFRQALVDARIPDLTRVLEGLEEQRTEGERRGRIEAELRRRTGTPPRPASQEDTSQPQRGEATNELEPAHEATMKDLLCWWLIGLGLLILAICLESVWPVPAPNQKAGFMWNLPKYVGGLATFCFVWPVIQRAIFSRSNIPSLEERRAGYLVPPPDSPRSATYRGWSRDEVLVAVVAVATTVLAILGLILFAISRW